MRDTLLIPKNFNPQKLIDTHLVHFKNKSGITIYSLAYICDCIIYRSITHKDDLFKKNRFIPLLAKYLKEIIPQYEHSIEFLIENNVIESDGYYIKGKKPYGYRLCKTYIGNGWASIPVAGNVKRKLMQKEIAYKIANPVIATLENKRKHLFGILESPLLKIDAAGAKSYLKENYPKAKLEMLQEEQGKYFDADAAIDQIIQSMDNFKAQIDNIANNRRKPSIDLSGLRLHSPITNLHKTLRSFLSYNGKPLIALDVKNSQPYFSLLLLRKNFYEKKGGSFNLSNIDRGLYRLMLTNNKTPIMLQEILKTLANTEDATFKNYIEDAAKGNIYDRFMDIKDDDPEYNLRRDIMKESFFKILYGRKSTKGKKFYEAYELPFRVFDLIKSVQTGETKKLPNKAKWFQHLKPITYLENNEPVYVKNVPEDRNGSVKLNKPLPAFITVDKGYAKLATTLQRIESHLLLDVVCSKVAKEHPNIPLVTVHDSIATTEEYIEAVEATIKEVLTEVIGFPPKLKRENWYN